MAVFKDIILVDDDEEDIDVFRITLANINKTANLHTFFDPVEAWYRLNAGDLFPDLIILDLNMPEIDGKQFLKLVKSHDKLKDVPVFIFSAASQLLVIEELIKLGAADYIVKPNSYKGLKEILINLFSKSLT